ncbi:MAG: M14 family zinc carboxypeptidase [Gaiellaceae bacterium]
MSLRLASAAILATVLAPSAHAGRTFVLGRSVEGRAIVAHEILGAGARVTVLVVGCIHGNEQAGIAVANTLERVAPLPGVDLWIVPVLNPDGVAADSRQNAHHVDLNRNFPAGWQALSGVYDSGPHALSEPEARIAYRLLLRLRPAVSIWFHQHLDLVDDSVGSKRLERLFATAAGLRLLPLTRYPGSVVTFQAARFPATTPFVVELPAGSPAPAQIARYVRAVLTVARAAAR